MAIVFYSTVDSAARWRAELARLMPEREFRVWPDIADPAAIDYAIVWRPPPELLASLRHVKLILSLGAGVDHLLANPGLPPGVPIARLVDPYLTDAMSEYVVLQVLRLHRQDLDYQAQQRRMEWLERAQKNAGERPIGILGCGMIGQDAARKLKFLGFDVAGWTRSARQIPGLPTYAGASGLDALAARSEILVCLLPLTAATEGILNAALFARLPRGAGLVNAGRGRHLVEEDLIPALDLGQLSAAALDVFREEPLAPDHPFWRHPRILVTPHIAGTTNPATAAAVLCDAIHRFEEGRAVPNLVDPARGY
jgi:glyoxylate/hydroxypyruvate reductase A